MYPVVFNRKELCRLSIDEFENLKNVVHFWGMVWQERSGEFVGRFSGHSIRVIGLDRKETRRLHQLLSHTGIKFVKEKVDGPVTLSIFTTESEHRPLTIETSGKSYPFMINDGPYQSTKEWVSKGIFIPDRSDEVKLHFSKNADQHKLELICYVVLQLFSHESPYDLDSVSVNQYRKLLQSVLTPINPSLASYQLKAEWPSTPPVHQTRPNEETETFNPFKHKHASQSTRIDPFKYKQNRAETRVINPFFKNKTP